jgi:glycerol-3-phosphate dehydrogenase (NAD(P)+)
MGSGNPRTIEGSAMKVAVLGAGAWGTAIAAAAAAKHDVCLWARDAAQAAQIQQQRENKHYLPGVPLPSMAITADWRSACEHASDGLLLIATPMSGLRDMLRQLPAGQAALWLCKGFESGSGALGHEIAQALRPGQACGVLSGPSFAQEVARGQPTALVCASSDEALAAAAVQALHGDSLRIYTSPDVVGVEVGGAVKNVLAIAVGILDGMAAAHPDQGPGLNARAALITRGLAEMTRLGVALGARAETFMGLSGLGDLVLTATGDLSRNRRVGLQLATGQPLAQILAGLGHVAEGVSTAGTVLHRARLVAVDMPISAAVADVLAGRCTPPEALLRLMAREARAEA